MFLSKLSETEKQAFLCLADGVMKADGVVADREMKIINDLRKEMNVQNLVSNLTENDSFKTLTSSKQSVRRGIYIELLSISMADGVIDANESIFMKKIQSQLELSDIFAKNSEKWVSAYFRLQEKGIELVRGKKKVN